MNNNSDYTFSLYVSGVKLSEINPLDSARLLEALCQLLGTKNLKWGDVKESSADYAVKVDPQYFDEKVAHFGKAVSEETGAYRTVTQFLSKYPQASTNLRYKNSANDEYVNLYTFERKEEGFTFVQHDTIRGRVVGLKEGLDKTDHIQVKAINGKTISVAISPNLSASLGSKWRTEHQLEFSGKAKYRFRSYNDLELLEFTAESVEEVENKSLTKWLHDFKNAGDSGWDEFDDPIAEWLKERHE